MKKNGTKLNKAFSLLEAVIYTALVGAVLAVMAYAVNSMFLVFNSISAQNEIVENARTVVDIIILETKQADEIYTPTSSSFQLSLKTSVNLPSGEEYGYVDFYLDNGRIYQKRDGQTQQPITSESVFVSNLSFQYLPQGQPDSVLAAFDIRSNIDSLKEELKARSFFSFSAKIRNK